MWTNTVYASQGHAFGLVIYIGKEARPNMSSKEPRLKSGILDTEIDITIKTLFCLMLFIAGIIVLADNLQGSWYFKYFRCLIMLTSIIPVSLRISLDFAKMFYRVSIEGDEDIPDTLVRNPTMSEELGRIDYLLCDKTGTLTQNDMIFKRVETEFFQYSEEDMDRMKAKLFTGR